MRHPKNVFRCFEFFLITTLSIFPGISAFCPNACTCDDVGLKVYCLAANLDVVPILLNPGTKHLDLSHNQIHSILPGFAFYHELRHLDLSHNRIESLGTKNFASQNNLGALFASSNRLTTIRARTFDGLVALGELKLNKNLIESIDNGTFQLLKNLKKLDLSSNKLKFLRTEIFLNLEGLERLNLCGNEIQSISERTLEHLVGLQDLWLCGNKLTTLTNNVFSKQKSLYHLFLHENNISSLSENTFDGLTSLRRIDIYSNSIRNVPFTNLSMLQNLERLDLGKNNYETIRANAFRSLINLKRLYISDNKKLHHIDSTAFSNLTNLQYLDLSKNTKLKKIYPSTLSSLLHLRELNLRDNSLQVFTENMFNAFELHWLDLSGNHLECNCSLNWLNKLLRNRNSSLRIEDVECYSPMDLKGQKLSGLSEYDLKCFSPFLLIVSSVSAITALILVALVAFFLYVKRCKKMKALVQDTWPEKIVTTWKGTDLTKKLETEDFIYGTSKTVSHIKISEPYYPSRTPKSESDIFEPNYTYEQIKTNKHNQNGCLNGRNSNETESLHYSIRIKSNKDDDCAVEEMRQSYQSNPSTLCSPQSIYAEPIYHISTVEGVLPQHQRSKDSGFYSCEFLDQNTSSSRHGSKSIHKNGPSRHSNFSLCRPSKSHDREGVLTLSHLYAAPKHPNFGYSNDTIYDNIL